MSYPARLMYLSRLAPDVSPTCVADIVRTARALNDSRKIHSLLIFDGWRFCHYIEGAASTVTKLAQHIRADRRHVQYRVLHQEAIDGPTTITQSGLDYALSYDDSLEGFETVQGADAFALLEKLLPLLDRAP